MASTPAPGASEGARPWLTVTCASPSNLHGSDVRGGGAVAGRRSTGGRWRRDRRRGLRPSSRAFLDPSLDGEVGLRRRDERGSTEPLLDGARERAASRCTSPRRHAEPRRGRRLRLGRVHLPRGEDDRGGERRPRRLPYRTGSTPSGSTPRRPRRPSGPYGERDPPSGDAIGARAFGGARRRPRIVRRQRRDTLSGA